MRTKATVSKPRMIIAIVALFLSSMCTMGDLVVTPIAADLFSAYADEPELLIDFAITGPALVGLPFSLLSGWLCDRFDKKWIMVAGFSVFTLSSNLGVVVNNIWYLVVMRCLATGVGWGITNTAAFSILADLYTDNDSHGRMVGRYNAAMSIMGAFLTSCSGILASKGTWQDAFCTYWISIPVLICLIVFLPSLKPRPMLAEDGHIETDEEVKAEDKGWWIKVIPLNIQVFFVAICYFVAMYMVSIYVESAGIGDESLAGALAACMTLSTAVGSLLFGRAYTKMKTAVYFPALIAVGVAMIVMGIFHEWQVAVVCSIVLGFSWAFFFCYFFAHCTAIVPANRAGSSTGLVSFFDGMAAAGCSYLLTGIVGATGLPAFGVWPIAGSVVLVVCIVSIVAYVLKGARRKS